MGTMMGRPRKNQVLKILKNENRGYLFDIKEESAFSVRCNGIETLPDQRFYKNFPSILVTQKGFLGKLTRVNRYIARDGTAYTQRVRRGGKIERVPLIDTVSTILGEEVMKGLAKPLYEKLEQAQIGVTIGLEDDLLTPNNPSHNPKDSTSQEFLPSISEEDIKREEDQEAAKTLWQERQKAMRGAMIEKVAWLGFGVGIGVIASIVLGWIRLDVPPTKG